MRTVIISDIHGNDIALQKALEAIQRDAPDQIICLGDVAASGPQPRETLERVQALTCPVVQGNTDAYLLEPKPYAGDDARLRMFFELDQWCADQLTDAHREFLRTFKPTVKRPLATGIDHHILCFHGSPQSYDDVIKATTPDETLAEHFADYDALILAGGHTHEQLFRRFRQHILINPGSIGLSFERTEYDAAHNPGWAEYAVVDVDKGRVQVNLRRVAFDVKQFLDVMRARQMPYAEHLASGWQ